MNKYTNKNRGKELILNIFKGEKVSHIPWVPFTGIHAGSLKNYTATEILLDGKKLLEVLLEVSKKYFPDGMPVVFDLQIEAEILGCELKWSNKSPPMVVTHPLENEKAIPTKIPQKTEGRLPLVLDVMHKLKKEVGETTALFGLVTGPLTLASHLRGVNFYLDLIKNVEYAKELLNYCTKVVNQIVIYYAEVGMDIIAIVDPVVSQISPRTFEEFLSRSFSSIFKLIKDSNKYSSFFVCGDATKNLDLMCQTKPDSIFVDENIDMKRAKEILTPYEVILGGNIPLTTTMLFGTQQDNMAYVINLIKEIGKERLIIAPGCDMPYDVPPENVIGAFQAVKGPETIEESLKNYEISEIDIEVNIPDYRNLHKPLIEVFTIDSDTCAACGYMAESVREMKKVLGDTIETVEYKFIEKENIARAKILGIKHLPCILINGELKFSSIIPSQEEFKKAITEKM